MIKCENMTYAEAIHNASIVLSLSSKANKYVKEILDPPDVYSHFWIHVLTILEWGWVHSFEDGSVWNDYRSTW